MMRVLVITTGRNQGGELSQRFHAAGHECVCVCSGREALGLERPPRYDVVMCVGELSAGEFAVVSRLGGSSDGEPPILFMVGAPAADDPAAESQRVAMLLREVAGALDEGSRAGRILRCDDLELDPGELRATRGGRELPLTPTEFRVLEVLVREAGTTVSRRMLCERVWSREWYGVTNVVDVYVSRVRRKVDRGRPPLVHTIRGMGYRLGPPSRPGSREYEAAE